MNVLPPGWEPPGALPAGVTVAPAADPTTAAKVIAERVGGEIVVDVSVAERVLAREASRRRARQVLDEAAEAARLSALLDGSDAAADRALLAEVDELRTAVERGRPAMSLDEVARRAVELAEAREARKRLLSAADQASAEAATRDADVDAHELWVAAAHLRAAQAAADAADRAVPRRPSAIAAEIEVLRARALVAEAEEAAAAFAGDSGASSANAAAGTIAVATGAALLLLGATHVPVSLAAVLPVSSVAGVAVTHRRRRLLARRAVAEVESCHAAAARSEAAAKGIDAAVEEWRARVEAAAAARGELADATTRWREVAGEDADVDDVEEMCARIDRRRAVEETVERHTLAAAAWQEAASSCRFDPTAPPDAVVAELRRRAAEADDARARLAELEAAGAREEARARLHALLHGRRLDRLHADAEQARHLVAGAAPRALVLCEPFAQLGPGRRRALLRDLERSVQGVAVAVVTADAEALAWAESRSRGGTTGTAVTATAETSAETSAAVAEIG